MLTLLSDKETHDLLTNIQAASDIIQNLTRIVGCAQTVTLELEQKTPETVKTVKQPQSQPKTRESRRKKREMLREADVREIKRILIAKELSAVKLAKRYGVHPTTINCIKYGKTWKHVEPAVSNVVTLHS
jgi:ribosome-binding protein aMBF1 (putative translation factor)